MNDIDKIFEDFEEEEFEFGNDIIYSVEFTKFLYEHNIFDEYINEICRENYCKRDISLINDRLIKISNGGRSFKYIINNSLTWIRTRLGVKFWDGIDLKWKNRSNSLFFEKLNKYERNRLVKFQ